MTMPKYVTIGIDSIDGLMLLVAVIARGMIADADNPALAAAMERFKAAMDEKVVATMIPALNDVAIVICDVSGMDIRTIARWVDRWESEQ